MVKGPEVVRGLQVGGGPEVGEVFKTQTSQETKLKINPTGDHAACSCSKKSHFFAMKIDFYLKVP